MSTRHFKGSLFATTIIAGLAVTTPAFAQITPSTTPPEGSAVTPTATTPQSPSTADTAPPGVKSVDPKTGEEIIITGSITRNPAAATASPVISVTADDIQKRGITTVTDYLQTMSANNAGTVPPSWSAFGFTTGASAPSLRGFNDAYTLVLFDGMRSAVYPLADDTQRNIVDINTVPNWSVGRIDTLLDNASATYGSDAIAGVVNIITKSEVQGIHANGSYGVSQRGDAREKRLSINTGYGDLRRDGFNVYAGVEWQKNDPLFSRDRGFPFNTADLSSICGTAEQGCLTNGIRNGIQANGGYNGFQSSASPAVRPYNPANVTPAGIGAAAGRFQYLNDCSAEGTTPFTLSAGQVTANTPANGVVCQQDRLKQYQMYNARISRKGATVRGTVRFGDSEAFASFNFYNTKTFNQGAARSFTELTAAGGRNVNPSGIFLPVYVCPQGVAVVGTNPATGNISGPAISSGCNASNGVLNPNNPFAANGQLALLSALTQRPIQTFTNAKTYRGAVGAHGELGNGFSYNLGATASKVDLNVRNHNYLYLKGLLNAVATGTYNFVNQDLNSPAAVDAVFPDNSSDKVSKLWQVQGALAKDLFQLPGGYLNVAVGAQYRHESLNAPSSNAPNDIDPYARYATINAVGVKGARNIWSLSYEVAAPILNNLRVKASGSYDHYSTGQKAFSPKFEAEFKPIEQLKFRGTYSKGFRAPNFNESFELPATGYTGSQIICSDPTYTAFCAAHASNPSYFAGTYSPGLTSSGNPSLKPEKSTGWTLGAGFQPRRTMTFTVDYWNTRIKNLIIPPSVTDDIITQYYTNNGVVNIPGITVIQGTPDPSNPGALPLLGFIQAPFQNANSFWGRGIDATADVRVGLPIANIDLRSVLSASYLMRLAQKNSSDNSVWRFDGTLGPCGWTSCSGAPKFRLNWQNTLTFSERANLTVTANYTSGYSLVAADSGNVRGLRRERRPGSGLSERRSGVVPWQVDLLGGHAWRVQDHSVDYPVRRRSEHLRQEAPGRLDRRLRHLPLQPRLGRSPVHRTLLPYRRAVRSGPG